MQNCIDKTALAAAVNANTADSSFKLCYFSLYTVLFFFYFIADLGQKYTHRHCKMKHGVWIKELWTLGQSTMSLHLWIVLSDKLDALPRTTQGGVEQSGDKGHATSWTQGCS